MIETFATRDGTTHCNECGQEITQCDKCEKEFEFEDELYCQVKKHFCYKCGDIK
jgi:hypothetical protein